MKKGPALIAISALLLAACQTHAGMEPATFEQTDAETVDTLRTHLVRAMGKANVDIMATDLTQETSVSVRPPPPGPHETHSLAMPIIFDVMTDNTACILVRRDTGERVTIPELRCQPARR